jgi:hypothetical protein
MPKIVYTIIRYTIAPFITHAPKEGAKPTLIAAIGDAQGGDYFGPTGFQEFKGKPGKVSGTAMAKDEDLAKRLWEKAEELVGLKYL